MYNTNYGIEHSHYSGLVDWDWQEEETETEIHKFVTE